jgi:hypothetical protein
VKNNLENLPLGFCPKRVWCAEYLSAERQAAGHLKVGENGDDLGGEVGEVNKGAEKRRVPFDVSG